MVSVRTRTSLKLGRPMSRPVGAYTAKCEVHPLVGKNGYVCVEIHAVIHLHLFSKCSCEAKMFGKAVTCWSLVIWRPLFVLQRPYLWLLRRRPDVYMQDELSSRKQMVAYNAFQSGYMRAVFFHHFWASKIA